MKFLLILTFIVSSSVFAQLAQEEAQIVNDQRWNDLSGKEIEANKGGHISKVGDSYYWVGCSLEDESILNIYQSKTFASDSWDLVYTDRFKDGVRNATMIYNPESRKFVVVGKTKNEKNSGVIFLEALKPTGPFKHIRTIFPRQDKFHSDREFGGMSVYTEKGNAYLIVARRDLDLNDGKQKRRVAIYLLDEKFTNLKKEILFQEMGLVEALWLFKRQGKYYMTASGTHGWHPSATVYSTAEKLSGPWTKMQKVAMQPESKDSFQSQHRWFLPIGDQWVYSGDRYPDKPNIYDPDKGRVIMLPVEWQNDKPIIKWQETWFLKTR